MIELTFDSNDTEAVKLIDDYLWYKEYYETLVSDWCHGLLMKEYTSLETSSDRRNELLDIVVSSLNQVHLEMAVNIQKYIFGLLDYKLPVTRHSFIDDVLFQIGVTSPKFLKKNLVNKYGNTKRKFSFETGYYYNV